MDASGEPNTFWDRRLWRVPDSTDLALGRRRARGSIGVNHVGYRERDETWTRREGDRKLSGITNAEMAGFLGVDQKDLLAWQKCVTYGTPDFAPLATPSALPKILVQSCAVPTPRPITAAIARMETGPRGIALMRGFGGRPADACQHCGIYLTNACYSKNAAAKRVPRNNKICRACHAALPPTEADKWHCYKYAHGPEAKGLGWNPDKPWG